jgi:hypothetical protein
MAPDFAQSFHETADILIITRNIQKNTPWPLVRKRTIPTERPPLVDEI